MIWVPQNIKPQDTWSTDLPWFWRVCSGFDLDHCTDLPWFMIWVPQNVKPQDTWSTDLPWFSRVCSGFDLDHCTDLPIYLGLWYGYPKILSFRTRDLPIYPDFENWAQCWIWISNKYCYKLPIPNLPQFVDTYPDFFWIRYTRYGVRGGLS